MESVHASSSVDSSVLVGLESHSKSLTVKNFFWNQSSYLGSQTSAISKTGGADVSEYFGLDCFTQGYSDISKLAHARVEHCRVQW